MAHGPRMTIIGQAYLSEIKEINKLIAEYHRSEGITPNKEKIASAVHLQLSDTPGLVLVARDRDTDSWCGTRSLHALLRTWACYDCKRFLRQT